MGVELPRRVDTVYLGGGTPSLLAPDLLARLFAAMRSEFDFDPDAEITVECAPGQLADDTLAALVAAGVNRVSLGVQSFIDSEAHSSGRLHSRATVADDLRRLRAAGIANLNVDLIAGLAGQTFASWQESLDVLIDSGVPHASVYMLEVDEDSRLGREMLAGGARYHAGLVPSDDAIARMYTLAIERLGRGRTGPIRDFELLPAWLRSRHNLRYWQRRPYLGLGLDASSMLRAGRMRRHSGTRLRASLHDHDDLAAFLEGSQPPKRPGSPRRANMRKPGSSACASMPGSRWPRWSGSSARRHGRACARSCGPPGRGRPADPRRRHSPSHRPGTTALERRLSGVSGPGAGSGTRSEPA